MTNSNSTQVSELRQILAKMKQLASDEGIKARADRLLLLYGDYADEAMATPEIFSLNPVELNYTPHELKEYVLIIPLYSEKIHDRAQEFIECLEKNLKHKRIKLIVVFYDRTGSADLKDVFLNRIKDMGVTVIDKNGRLTYEEAFNYANDHFSGQFIIIANADIYFNDTLMKLDHADLTNVFLCLTRWNVQPDRRLEIAYLKLHSQKSFISQDAWIFKAPLAITFKCDFQMGINHCDSFLNYHLQKSSALKVVNPCLDIQVCHLHLSNIRSADLLEISKRNAQYEEEQAQLGNYDQGVQWSHLTIKRS